MLDPPLWDGLDVTYDKSWNIMHYMSCKNSCRFLGPFKFLWSAGLQALLQSELGWSWSLRPPQPLVFSTLSYRFINNELLCPFIVLVHLVLSMIGEGRFHIRGDCSYSPQSTMIMFFSFTLVICKSLWLWLMVGLIFWTVNYDWLKP